MIDIQNSEDVALQTISMVISASVTIIGEAPHYTKINDVWTLVTIDMPYWSIKKILTDGANVLTRSADGVTKHNKVLSSWNSYTY